MSRARIAPFSALPIALLFGLVLAWVSRRDQQCSFSVFQDLRDLVQGAGGNRLAHRHILEQFGGRAEKRIISGHRDVRRNEDVGRVQEVAGTVAFLASDDAGYVTASAFPLDGGITVAYTIPS